MGYYAEELDEFYRERANGRLSYFFDMFKKDFEKVRK